MALRRHFLKLTSLHQLLSNCWPILYQIFPPPPFFFFFQHTSFAVARINLIQPQLAIGIICISKAQKCANPPGELILNSCLYFFLPCPGMECIKDKNIKGFCKKKFFSTTGKCQPMFIVMGKIQTSLSECQLLRC